MTKNNDGEGNGIPVQYSCLEDPVDGGAWWAAVHGVSKSRTRLSDFTFTFHFPALEKEMATHSSVLAWRIPGTGEPGGLPSMGSHRVGHDWSDLAAAAAARIMRADFKMAPEEPKWSWKDGWINTQWSSIWWNIIQSGNRRKFWHTPQHEWTLKNYAEWNKSDTKGQLLYDSTSVRYTE